MSDTETETLPAATWKQAYADARAELSRLRGVVEAVQAVRRKLPHGLDGERDITGGPVRDFLGAVADTEDGVRGDESRQFGRGARDERGAGLLAPVVLPDEP